MFLIIMRHGDALPRAATDFERVLSEHGEQEAAVAAKEIGSRDFAVDAIYCSPLVRARQTANIVRQHLPEELQVETWLDLEPGAGCEAVADRLGALTQPVVMLVSHQPFVGRMIRYLTGQDIGMDTGMIVGINIETVEQHCGEVAWVGPVQH
jgi:phosphohistidine phosphatase